MSGRLLSRVGSIAVVTALCMTGGRLGVPNSARADDCLTAPNSSAPQGSHWYYHMDRTGQRKCWHFRAPGESAQDTTAQAKFEAAPVAQSHSRPAPFGSIPTTAVTWRRHRSSLAAGATTRIDNGQRCPAKHAVDSGNVPSPSKRGTAN
jgi:hypothetical protein